MSNVLVLGLTFKENCPNIGNSKAIGVIRELKDYGCNVIIHDPWADAKEVEHEYGLPVSPRPDGGSEAAMDAVVLAVSHDKFRDVDFTKFTKKNVVFGIKSVLPRKPCGWETMSGRSGEWPSNHSPLPAC